MKNQTDSLNDSIALLEAKQQMQLEELREQFYVTYESLKPMNLIKHAWHEATTAPDMKDNLIGNVIGFATGYVSKKVLVGATHNPIKKIIGTVLQFAIANVVSKHSDKIKSAGESILGRIIQYNKDKKQRTF